jgi:hypothetical protein
MVQIPKQAPASLVFNQPDGELVCLLCGTVVADVYGQRVVHKSSCDRPLPWSGKRPRCCRCGGAVVWEPNADRYGGGLLPGTRAGSDS